MRRTSPRCSPARALCFAAGLLGAAALGASCAALQGPKTLPSDSGVLYLYLAALPDEAQSLQFEIDSIAALDGAGVPRPLEVRSRSVAGAAPRRQKLLAMGALPTGTYRALAISLRSARRRVEGEAGDLQVSEEPAAVEASFTIESGKALVLDLRLQLHASIVEGNHFAPVFTAGTRGMLAQGLYALGSSSSDGALVLFHKLSGEVFDVLRTGPRPVGVVLDSERRRAFVASSEGDTLEVYDIPRGVREQRFPVLVGDRPSGIALAPDGRTLACTLTGANALGIYDAPALAERARVGVGLEPSAVLIDPSGRKAYVFNSASANLTVVDLVAGSAAGTIATDAEPVFGAFDRAGRRLYVIHRRSPYLLVLGLPRLAVERRAYIGPNASAIAVDSRTDHVFVARRGTGQVEVLDPISFLVIDAIEIGSDVSFLAVSREDDRLYAAAGDAREVRSIPLTGARVAAITEFGREPVWIAVAGER